MLSTSGTLRFLHLVEPAWRLADDRAERHGGDDCSLLACAAATVNPGRHQHTTLVIGGPEASTAATYAGLHPATRLHPPLNIPSLAAPAARRFIATAGPFDFIIAWGRRLSRLAHRLPCSRGIAVVEPDRTTVRRLHADPGTRSPREFIASPPPIIALSPSRLDRNAIRRACGLPTDMLLLGVVAPIPRLVDASRAQFLVGLLRVAGHDLHLGLSASMSGLDRAMAPERELHTRGAMHLTSLPAFAINAACDVCVMDLGPRCAQGIAHLARSATPDENRIAALLFRSKVPIITAVKGLIPHELEPLLLACSAETPAIARTVANLIRNPYQFAEAAALLHQSCPHLEGPASIDAWFRATFETAAADHRAPELAR